MNDALFSFVETKLGDHVIRSYGEILFLWEKAGLF